MRVDYTEPPTVSQSLAQSGVKLSQSYVSPKCSPSRAALMTGLYPWRLGMQRGAIERFQPDGLNTSLTLLPQHLQQAGYSTHLVSQSHISSVYYLYKEILISCLNFYNLKSISTFSQKENVSIYKMDWLFNTGQ